MTHIQQGFSLENATWRNAYFSAAKELIEDIPNKTKNNRILRNVFKGVNIIYT